MAKFVASEQSEKLIPRISFRCRQNISTPNQSQDELDELFSYLLPEILNLKSACITFSHNPEFYPFHVQLLRRLLNFCRCQHTTLYLHEFPGIPPRHTLSPKITVYHKFLILRTIPPSVWQPTKSCPNPMGMLATECCERANIATTVIPVSVRCSAGYSKVVQYFGRK